MGKTQVSAFLENKAPTLSERLTVMVVGNVNILSLSGIETFV